MKKISFILHGNNKKIPKLMQQFQSLLADQYTLDFRVTQAEGEAISLTEKAIREGADYVIGVGGDGTTNELINGVMAVPEAERNGLMVGILPAGTGNDTSRTLGINRDPAQLAQLILSGKSQLLDLGKATFTGLDGQPDSRYFINIADLGMGGEVVKRVAKGPKWLSPGLIYAKSILQTFASYKKQKGRFTIPGTEWEGPMLSLVFANCKYFGGGMCIAPQADPMDGKFQIVLMANVSLWDYLKNVGNVKKGRTLKHPQVFYHEASECRVESLEEPLAVDMDGEFVGYSPMQVEVVPKAINFVTGGM